MSALNRTATERAQADAAISRRAAEIAAEKAAADVAAARSLYAEWLANRGPAPFEPWQVVPPSELNWKMDQP
jgi:hypothetical protein